ncbi:MAG: polysaccharide pyruvyl transferase family protein [Oliverpabstia sp.]|nr:polysaccharide pyruvyl transferase family protein [Oliverpabstia sp.]
MSKIILYYHAGAANHGCEAIVRATKKILNQDMVLYSVCPEEDIYYGLDKLADIQKDSGNKLKKGSIEYLWASLAHHVRHDDFYYISLSHKDFFDKIEKGDICLSIGGDNYCYAGRDILGYYNKRLHQKGAKTVLWGCSFDPDDMTPTIAEDLAKYDLIVAREGISYHVLKEVNSNTVLFPDPAFQLDKMELPLPKGFKAGHTIGVNISPLATDYGIGSMVMDNYREMIRWLIVHTQEQILLVPHVVKSGNDDRTTLKTLYDEFVDTGRILLLDDHNCMELKGYIARCRFFVGARTHATIAAYSTCVPTLVVGYSVKAKGIAQELFGTDENYVLPVQSFQTKSDLTTAFQWLMNHEDVIRNRLKELMPEYKQQILSVKEKIEML